MKLLYDNFEISLLALMPNITTNHAITYTNKFFYLRIVKGTKSNIFTSKLCAWVIFITLLTRLLCHNSNSRPDVQTTKGAKSNTFTCKLYDCISHADWLFTVIIVTWMYEDLFCLVTSDLNKGCFLKKQ